MAVDFIMLENWRWWKSLKVRRLRLSLRVTFFDNEKLNWYKAVLKQFRVYKTNKNNNNKKQSFSSARKIFGHFDSVRRDKDCRCKNSREYELLKQNHQNPANKQRTTTTAAASSVQKMKWWTNKRVCVCAVLIPSFCVYYLFLLLKQTRFSCYSWRNNFSILFGVATQYAMTVYWHKTNIIIVTMVSHLDTGYSQ